jgi:hypothetical protein
MQTVEVLPQYHWKVSPPDPPVGFAVRVADCPLSRIEAEEVGSPAVSAELVVTVADGSEAATSGVDALSATSSSKA